MVVAFEDLTMDSPIPGGSGDSGGSGGSGGWVLVRACVGISPPLLSPIDVEVVVAAVVYGMDAGVCVDAGSPSMNGRRR